jgi:transcriptional regulator with XRE-family HTH domain
MMMAGGVLMMTRNKKQAKRQKNPYNCKVGKRLKRVRQEHGHTVRFLAGILNLEEDSYRRIEYGTNSLSADKANILHQKLGYDLNYIIGGTEMTVEHEYAATDEVLLRMLSDMKTQLEVIEKNVVKDPNEKI